VVDGGGLENHCARKGTGGSNPSPSARFQHRGVEETEDGRVGADADASVATATSRNVGAFANDRMAARRSDAITVLDGGLPAKS
jgi:hypothetical protein